MAAQTYDLTAADAVLKTLYPSKRIKYVGYRDNPLLALVPKNDKFFGRNLAVPIWYGGNASGSRVFAKAQANQRTSLHEDFLITRVRDYALGTLDMETLLATANDEGAFISSVESEVDGTIRGAARNLAVSLYRNKGGARGQIGSIASGVMTLLNTADVTNFERGMTLVQSTADGTSGSLGSGLSEITAVNRREGKLTAANWTNFTANDYLFREGDFGVSISGLASWIPQTAPTVGGGDSFFGVDRAADSRLYGQYHDGSAQTIQEALEAADVKLAVEGGKASHVFMNPRDVGTLRTGLGSSVIYDKVSSPDMASISFSTLALFGLGTGKVNIVPDRNCPAGLFYMLDMDTWMLHSLGGGPKIFSDLNGQFLTVATADSLEFRVGHYAQLACNAPGYNLVGKLY